MDGNSQPWVDFLRHYVADFITLGPPASPVCYNNLQACIQLCAPLGLPLHPDKLEEPSTCLSILGIELDSSTLQARLPPQKREKIIALLGTFNIPVRLLKNTAHEIAPSLCAIFNKSIRLVKFPTEWKVANIVPVHKRGSVQHTESYRPISLLSVVLNIMERCVFNGIKDGVNRLIQRCHHGFTAGRSCVTQLVQVLDIISSHLDNGCQTHTVYLDMSNAFDRVSHRKLINKLRQYGFGGNILQWFASFLTNRSQRVTVPWGGVSTSLPVTSGVPQGSILGPMLFLLFVNDLPDSITSGSVATFADDTKVFKVVNSCDDASDLQSDLNRLGFWADNMGMLQLKSTAVNIPA